MPEQDRYCLNTLRAQLLEHSSRDARGVNAQPET
jgi:hypothetical protein